MSKSPLIFIRSSLPHRFLSAVTTNFDHGPKVSTEMAQQYPLSIEFHHRRSESREGDFQCHPSKSCFWFCQCPPDDDKGIPPIL
jgi:hypothetical protein